jgi:hypothetical protein
MTEELVCKLCVLDRRSAKLPPNIDGQIRYSTAEALREHWNAVHSLPTLSVYAIQEARTISAGIMVACGDGECTFHVLWCLHCDYETSDPVAVELKICPKCGRNYADSQNRQKSDEGEQ